MQAVVRQAVSLLLADRLLHDPIPCRSSARHPVAGRAELVCACAGRTVRAGLGDAGTRP